jgi:hypothetical protein
VRVKLAEMLARKLALAGYVVRTDPENLWPNQGYWRCQGVKADVMAWEGQIELFKHDKWLRASVHSWETMGECVRGFSVEEEGFLRFMLTADAPLPNEKRYRHSAHRFAR